MQTTSFRLGGEHVDDHSASPARDWDEFLGIDPGTSGLDGLVHSLDYGFQDAAVTPLVHDHYSPSRKAAEHLGHLAHGYTKAGHVLMPNVSFHQTRGSLTPYSMGIDQQQEQLQLYRYHQHQHQHHQLHRRNMAQPASSGKQARHQRSHKRKAELMAFSNASPGEEQNFHSFAEGSSSDTVEQAVIYPCVKQAKPAAAASATATHVGRWTKKEHELFLEGLKLYGRSWKKISTLVVTRTLVQIRTHAQKYLQKQSRAAQKFAAAAAGGANDMSASPATSCVSTPSSTFAPDPHDSSSSVGNSSGHPMIDQELLLLNTPMAQTSGIAYAGWRLSPPRGQALLPVEFPTSMSLSAPLASPRPLAQSCPSSSSPSSLAPLPSSMPGANFVSSFKLDQLLQDEPSGACDDGEYYAGPSSASLRSEPKLAQRILAPAAQESSDMLEKSAQRRSNASPRVLNGHELLHTFDHIYAGSLLASPSLPSLPSPALTSSPRMDAYGYCDWM
jgi:SHAQKYF class myb-like DNA-binding protein